MNVIPSESCFFLSDLKLMCDLLHNHFLDLAQDLPWSVRASSVPSYTESKSSGTIPQRE